eukprot:gene4721-5895_t
MGKRKQKKPNTWDQEKTKKKNKLGDEGATTMTNSAAASDDIRSSTFWADIVPRNALYESYYKAIGICKTEEEWEQFMKSMARPLPTTFRINTTIGPLQNVVIKQLKEIVEANNGEDMKIEIDGELIEPPKPLEWYPNQTAWKTSIPKKSFRKNPKLEKFHQFLVHHDQQGHITRQEAVSMIPPLFLNVESHHNVLDMCAAPGSKTSQILEALHIKNHNLSNPSDVKASDVIPTGSVIANDVDTNRCYMLVHQTTRIGSPAIVVTNHEAQNFPLLTTVNDKGETVPLYLDRILADVPCSGDGTNRKNPELWKKWHHAAGIGLHTVQYKIALKAAHLLKVGGRMVYSTCSMNPVENEAVVVELLTRTEGAMRLVDVSAEYPQLIRAPGIYSWPVVDKEGSFEKFEDMPETKKYKHPRTLFPPTLELAKELHLERCMRVYPHFQDTGGFFIAVLEKVKDCPNQMGKKTGPNNNNEDIVDSTTTPPTTSTTTPPITTDQDSPMNTETTTPPPTSTTTDASTETTTTTTTTATTNNNKQQQQPKKEKARDKRIKFFEEPFSPLSEQLKKELEVVINFYGLSKEFPVDQLLSRSEKSAKIYLGTKSVFDLIRYDTTRKMKIINTGLKIFQRHEGLGRMECPYRISQDAIQWIVPFMSKRVINMTHQDLSMIIEKMEPLFTHFPAEIEAQLKQMEPGCYVIRITGDQPSSGCYFAAWLGKTSTHLLVPKLEIESLKKIFGLEQKEERLSVTKRNNNQNSTKTEVETTTTSNNDCNNVDDSKQQTSIVVEDKPSTKQEE